MSHAPPESPIHSGEPGAFCTRKNGTKPFTFVTVIDFSAFESLLAGIIHVLHSCRRQSRIFPLRDRTSNLQVFAFKFASAWTASTQIHLVCMITSFLVHNYMSLHTFEDISELLRHFPHNGSYR